MDHEAYKEKAKRTLSDGFHPEIVNPSDVLERLADFEWLAKNLDNDKKGLFYGREPKPVDDVIIQNQAFEVNELHMILGLITEVAELCQVLRTAWARPCVTDQERVADELGDVEWYLAGVYRERALKQTDVLRGNIAKLEARFPDKFTEDLALNRNTDNEESALRSSLG